MSDETGVVATGITTFDRLIEGGFQRGTNVLLAGQAGAGKTTFALQFLHHGATRLGENGVYASFVENTRQIRKNALAFGWDFERLGEKVKFLDLIGTIGERGANQAFEVIIDAVEESKASRVVIDTLSAMTTYFQTKAEARTFIGILNRFLERAACTSLSMIEIPWARQEIGQLGFEEFMGDGLIILESRALDLRVRRRLYIPKLRGRNHSLDCFDFFITGEGIRVSPVPSASEGKSRGSS